MRHSAQRAERPASFSAATAMALALPIALSGCGSDDETTGAGGGGPCSAAQIINCGHRGTGTQSSSNPFPENTIESVAQAYVEGAQRVEFDVLHSADGVLVVMHDDTVDRTTDGTGCVGDLTVAELQALDAAAGTSLGGSGVTIPTLAELMAAVDGALNIEIKLRDDSSCPESDVSRLAADVVSAIQQDADPARVVVSSFDAAVLSELKNLDSTIPAGLLTFDPDDHVEATSRGLDALNIHALVATESTIAAIHGAGLDANVWTVNDEAKMRELAELGVDMLITDEPDVLAAVTSDLCDPR